MKRYRDLTVYQRGDPYRRIDKPEIRLMGQWVREAGFQPGDRFTVTIHTTGVLTITRKEVNSHD